MATCNQNQKCSTCTSTSICSNSVTDCSPFQFPSVPNVQDFDNQQPYSIDTSWPCLLPINTSSKLDIYAVFPGSYMAKSMYRFSRQGMGKNAQSQFHFATMCASSGTARYQVAVGVRDEKNLLCGAVPPTLGNQPILSAHLHYTAQYPYIDKDLANPMVNPCADTTFAPPNTNLFQYYYSATVPMGVYSVAKVSISTTKPPECKVSGVVSCDSCNTQHVNDAISAFGYVNPSGEKAFTNATIFAESSGYQSKNTGTSIMSDCTNMDMVQSTCANNPPPTYGVYAHMRDGFLRLNKPYGKPECGTLTCYGSCSGSTLNTTYTSLVFSGYYDAFDNSGINIVAFPTTSTCSSINDLQKPACKYLQDIDKSGNSREKFLQVTFEPDKLNNIYFAETSIDGKTNLVKSFNIAGRFPGCLTLTEANPSKSFYLATSMSDFMHVGGTLASQAGDWTWKITRDIGSHQSGQTLPLGTTDNKYTVWDPDNSAYANWPSINGVGGDGVPDMVARIIFYNPDLFQPWDATTPPLTNDIVANKFHTNTPTLFLQNTPVQDPGSMCSKLYVHAFERGVAFLEYVSTIAYSLMYAYNLESAALQAQYFEIDYNVFVSNGTYAMKDFLVHLYSRMQVQVNSKAKRPMLFDSTDRTVQDEFDSWVNETLVNTDHYMKYPSFRLDGSDLYIQLYMHPMMHANFQSNIDQADWEISLGVYLNNFFQDFASQLAGGTTELGKTKSVGVLGDIVVRKGDDFYDGPTGLPITLVQGTTKQTSTIDIGYNTQKYSVSYMYEAQISRMSVGALIYLLQNNSLFPIDIASVASVKFPQSNVSLPTLMVNVDPSVPPCMIQKPITQACIKTLCNSESDCLCDFSAVIGKIGLKNPASSEYMNNSNGPCACLASDSYPQGPEISRAMNPVGLCFSKTCQDIQLPITDSGFCPDVGCSTLTQTLHQNKKGSNDWFSIFPDQGTGVDLNKLNNMCNTDFVHEGDLQSEKFEINWYILAGSLCLALAAPLALALDYFGMNQKRTKSVYFIWLGIIVFMLALSGLLFYSLSGVFKCKSFQYTNLGEAQCTGRFGLLPLTKEACHPHPTLFCQCKQSGAQCTNYPFTKGKDVPPECTADGVCALCPNAMTKIDILKDSKGRTKIPTTWLYLGVGAWFLVSGLVCFTLASYFKNLGLNLIQRIGFLSLIGLLIMVLGFGCLVAGINHTQTTTFSIDKDSQKNSKDTNPCD